MTPDRLYSDSGMLTLQERLDVVELAGVVQLPEVLGLLREVFSLRERVSLVCDNVGCDVVELRHERGEINGWRMVSSLLQWLRRGAVLLHAPMAFWNLFSSPASSCASAACCALSCTLSSELRASMSAPSIRAPE
jgi:hypothetical protein